MRADIFPRSPTNLRRNTKYFYFCGEFGIANNVNADRESGTAWFVVFGVLDVEAAVDVWSINRISTIRLQSEHNFVGQSRTGRFHLRSAP
jgi:hypothetical protein